MDNFIKTKYKSIKFDNADVEQIKCIKEKGQNWPIVYILTGKNEAYVGETNNAYYRMKQHLANKNRVNLENILLLLNDSFNKSSILDIESKLIQYMHADGKYILQNENNGQSIQNNYYQRGLYEQCFEEIWQDLRKKKIATKTIIEIKNSEIFKYSPYKEITLEQYDCIEKMTTFVVEAFKNNISKKIVVTGGAGTGKTVLAIYFIKYLIDNLHRKTNFEDIDSSYLNDLKLEQIVDLIDLLQKQKTLNIGFVVPTPAFRETVKKIFKATKGLKSSMVIGPNDIIKKDYDIVIVDEAHRLKQRKDLVNYKAYNMICDKLNLPRDSTQLDWILAKKRPLTILFYDSKQRIKNSDMNHKDFVNFVADSDVIELTTQLRVTGGNEYINFINDVLNNKKSNYNSQNYDLRVFDDFETMENSIREKNEIYKGLCRVVSGISYKYSTKMRDKVVKKAFDVDVDGDGKYLRMWNLSFNDSTFITDESHKDEIGCVYTCQGYDLNYAGVILGPDIFYNKETKKIDIHINKCTDKKAKVKNNEEETKRNILNQYLVLLTRGLYGTYIYAVDKDLRDYLNSLIK